MKRIKIGLLVLIICLIMFLSSAKALTRDFTCVGARKYYNNYLASTTVNLVKSEVSVQDSMIISINYRFSSDIVNNELLKTVYASDNNSIATVDSTGKITGIKEGTTNIKIITATPNYDFVCIENKAITVTKYIKNSDTSLSSLNVNNQPLNPIFNSNIKDYSLAVDYDVNEITLHAISSSSKSSIEGNGTYRLIPGDNMKIIKVTAEDGSTNQYTVNIIKAQANLYLKELIVINQNVNETFNKSLHYYTVDVPNSINTIDIIATPEDNKATVKIIGNTSLREGNNNIVITVISSNGITKDYLLNVNRKAEEKVVINDKTNNNDSLKYILIIGMIFLCLGLMIVGSLIIISANKSKKIIKGEEDETL